MDSLTARVLLVEDSPSDAQLIQHTLRQARGARFEVAVAERVDAAMAKLREEKFDVALLDLGLPDSTGLAGLARIQAEFPGLPIVILTGGDRETTGAEAIRYGAQDYLVKGRADARAITSAIRYAIERKQAETALQTTMQRFYGVLSSMYSAVLLVSDEGRVEFANQAFCDSFCLTDAPADLAGLSSREMMEKIKNRYLHPEEAAARIREILERGQPVKGEELAMQDGKTCLRDFVPLNVHGRSCGRLWFQTDITERKRAEEARRESEEKYRRIIETTNEGIWIVDAERRTTYANARMAEMLGCSVEEMMSKPWTDFVDADGKAASDANLQKRRQRGKDSYEYKLIRKDGSRLWVIVNATPVFDSSGHFAGSVSMLTDIAKRKETEDALRRSEARLSRSQEIAHLGSWELDLAQNRLSWSDEVYRIFGLQPQEFGATYEAFLERVHPEDRAKLDDAYSGSLRENRDAYEVEHRVVRKDTGEVRTVHERCQHFRDAAGKIFRSVGMVHDVTDRKKAEEALREMNETLERRVAERTAEAQRLAGQLRALASDLSQTEQRERRRLAAILHDHIQQLLVAARMQVEWLKHDGNSERRLAAAQSVDGILKEALDASRSLAVELSPPILHEAGLIAALNWLASRVLDKNQFAVHLCADDRAEPAGEEMRFLLFECARELLFNAVKHAGVSKAQLTLQRTIDGRVKLTVRDEGKGFDLNLLGARLASEATFGLFSIQQRLAHIGGEMEIATAPGKGTNITLTVPGGDAQSRLRGAHEIAQKQVMTGQKSLRQKAAACRVLIVDDHKIMREGLAGLMQFEPDIEIVGQAADAPQGIELAEKLEPDVVVMDLNLGEMSGVEATKRILARNPNIKVIGLSMHSDKDMAGAMREAGATGYITKGAPSEDLITAIRLCALSVPDHRGAAEHPTASAAVRPVLGRESSGTERNNIRVLVADDHDYLRQMLVEHLRDEAGIEVVGQAKDGEEAVRLALSLRPDAVVMDLSMPKMNGIEAARKLTAELPDLRVIGLSAYGETDAQTAAMRAAGAVDCVLKESSCEKLVGAIRTACSQ